jgi:hypothetical protein
LTAEEAGGANFSVAVESQTNINQLICQRRIKDRQREGEERRRKRKIKSKRRRKTE